MQFSSEFYVHDISHAGKDKNVAHSFDLGVGKVKSTKKTATTSHDTPILDGNRISLSNTNKACMITRASSHGREYFLLMKKNIIIF